MVAQIPKVTPPTTEQELMTRANALAGLTLGQVAKRCGQQVPATLRQDKGWVGQLLEHALGASAGSLAEPDFQLLGIELKTIPLNRNGSPRESTYICVVPLREIPYQTWRTSNVWRKMARVLWMPIEADSTIPIIERKIGNPLLWTPDAQTEAQLQQDWEELAELISLGHVETINARQGVYLQIRPKAAHSRVLCEAVGISGEKILTLPRGFYLRTKFTQQILAAYYV